MNLEFWRAAGNLPAISLCIAGKTDLKGWPVPVAVRRSYPALQTMVIRHAKGLTAALRDAANHLRFQWRRILRQHARILVRGDLRRSLTLTCDGPSRANNFFKRRDGSFTEHVCYDEDDEGSEKASASEEIYQGVTSGGKHGCYYQCDHMWINR